MYYCARGAVRSATCGRGHRYTNGRGPENIFFDSTPPDGTYAVSVDYYYGSTSTDYTVVISAGGDTLATLTGTLASSAAAEANVADIVVSGGSITVNN